MMKPKTDPLVELITHAGLDPRAVTLEQVKQLVLSEARMYRGRAMAAVQRSKAEMLVTIEEAREALNHPEIVGDEDLSARTLRAGENAELRVLVERGFYDARLAQLRIDTNIALDDDEVRVLAKSSPSGKRQAGRPSARANFAKWLAMDVEFRRAAGEASSAEKVLERLTGRDRGGNVIPGITPILVLPRGVNSHRTLTGMLKAAADSAPALLEEARHQGEIVRAGGQADPEFYNKLLEVRGILTNPSAIKKMLRAVKG